MSKGQSKIAQIQAKKGEIEVGGVTFSIEPLTNKEFTDFIDEIDGNSDMNVILEKMVFNTLKKDDPSITWEEFQNAPSELSIKALDEVERVNGLEDFFSEAEIEEAKKQL